MKDKFSLVPTFAPTTDFGNFEMYFSNSKRTLPVQRDTNIDLFFLQTYEIKTKIFSKKYIMYIKLYFSN